MAKPSAHMDKTNRLPAEYDYQIYITAPGNRDLAGLSETEALAHYQNFGVKEGRTCSVIRNRSDFIALAAKTSPLLEIGPFYSPAFNKADTAVRYLDCLSSEELRKRAESIAKEHVGKIPEIDYVWTGQRYREIIDRKFVGIFSSHNIEHQPCLITHLHDLESVLGKDGLVYLVVPDKRYCFDHYAELTTTPDVVEAYLGNTIRHRIKNVLEHRFFPTHNDPVRHWRGDHGPDPGLTPLDEQRSKLLLTEIEKLRLSSDYYDVHAWKFTPAIFRTIIENLNRMGLTPLRIERVYQTQKNSNEFYVVLKG